VLQHHLGWLQRPYHRMRSTDALSLHIRAVYGAVNESIPTRVLIVGSEKYVLLCYLIALTCNSEHICMRLFKSYLI